MHLHDGDGHHAEDQSGDGASEQTDRQEQSASELDQAREKREGRRQADLGREELAGRLETVAAESAEQFLRAVWDEKQARRRADERFGEGREPCGDGVERGENGAGGGRDECGHLWFLQASNPAVRCGAYEPRRWRRATGLSAIAHQ